MENSRQNLENVLENVEEAVRVREEQNSWKCVEIAPGDMKYINCLHKCTNAYLKANLAVMERRCGSSDNDSSIIDPLTIGITQLVGSCNLETTPTSEQDLTLTK